MKLAIMLLCAALAYGQLPKPGSGGGGGGGGGGGAVNTTNTGPGGAEILKSATGVTTITARQVLAGEGIVLTQQTDTVTAQVDTAIIPRYLTGSTIPTGTCNTGRDTYTRTGTQEFYACVSAAWVRIWQAAPGPSTQLDLSSAGHCYLLSGCNPMAGHNRAALLSDAVANNVVMVRVPLPSKLKLATMTVYIAGSGSASAALSVAVYADTANAPGVKVSADWRLVDTATSRQANATWDNTILNPGVYWVAVSSESATALFHLQGGAYTTWIALLGGMTVPGAVKCSNLASGTGANYALPATCGTPTAWTLTSADLPNFIAAAQ